MKRIRPLLENYGKTNLKLSFYSLVEVPVDQNGGPLKDDGMFIAFSTKLKSQDFDMKSTSLKTYMLGDLTKEIAGEKKLQYIKINPFNSEHGPSSWEEVIVAPIFDPITHKHLISAPDEALSLLAIDMADEKRFGIKFVFYSITNKALPDFGPEREVLLEAKIKELSNIIPRVPIEKGSATFFCILLNLNKPMEETAFIRNYKTLDPYTDILFVNSNFDILTGDLDQIFYDGASIDTILKPIISWQQEKSNHTLFRNDTLSH